LGVTKKGVSDPLDPKQIQPNELIEGLHDFLLPFEFMWECL
jgi:hypothetical protein